MAMYLMIRWSTTVRNRRVPISFFMGTLATDDQDKELKIIWEFMVLREYRMGDCHEDVMRPTTWSLCLTDRCYFLCFSGQRRTIAI